MISQRDIILVPFPFSYQSGTKVRPALVISKDNFNKQSKDVIVCAMTSNLSRDFYAVQIEPKDQEEGRVETSMVKVESLIKMEQSLAIKKIGKVKSSKFQHILEKLYTLFED